MLSIGCSMTNRTPKEIGRLAGRAFGVCLPGNWAVRSQEDQEDYGVDYEIELTTPADKATGFIFKIQQKGVNEAVLLGDGETISYSLPTAKLEYYMRDLRIPIIFVLVDVSTGKCYWLRLQGDQGVERRLTSALKAKNEWLTLHVSTRNDLSVTVNSLLQVVSTTFDFLTIESLKNMPLPKVGAVIGGEVDLDELERSLKLTQSVIRSEKTQRMINQGKLKEAYKLNLRAFNDEEETIEGRFSAGMEIVRVLGGIAVKEEIVNKEELLKLRYTTYHRLVSITRPAHTPLPLKHYSIFLARIARLRIVVDQDLGIFLSRQAQGGLSDEFSKLITDSAQQRSTVRVIAEMRRVQRRLVELGQKDWGLGLAIYAWCELTETLGPFLIRLEEDSHQVLAASIREWLDGMGKVCLALAETMKDTQILGLCCLNHLRIGTHTDSVGERLRQANERLKSLSSDQQPEIREQLKRYAEAMQSSHVSEPLSDDDREELVRQIARGLGINIDDPEDDIAQVIRIGLQDANPGRVVRNCENLFVRIEFCGIPAQMVGLPTAGFKSVCCTLHHHRVGALSLDDAYSSFHKSHCESCPDKCERAVDWSWTLKWQEQQESRFSTMFSDLNYND